MNRYISLIFPGLTNGERIAQAVARRYGLELFEMGTYLEKILSSDTPLAKEIRLKIDGEKPLTGEVLTRLVAHFLANEKIYKGVVFVNWPRSAGQAEMLDAVLEKSNVKLTFALGFDPPEAEIMETIETYAAASTESEADFYRAYKESHEKFLEIVDYYLARGVFRKISNWEDVQSVMDR